MSATELDTPFRQVLERQGFVVLDGGLATELEARGAEIQDELWSAKVLVEDPDTIRNVHYDYIAAGADCISSASYQATVEGFQKRGLSREKSVDMLGLSVRLALEARDSFWEDPANRTGRLRPLVAASVGPYGAYLADGSEYDGRYGMGAQGLVSFHRERWHLLAEGGVDLMACETIPSGVEAHALSLLMEETPGTSCLFSFSCKDSDHLCDGSLLDDVIAPLNESEQVVAIGVNCVPPSLIPELIATVTRVTHKPVVVYPNSGETWDATTKTWLGIADPVDFGVAAKEWYAAGARVIGGCCRTGPMHVEAIRDALAGCGAIHNQQRKGSG